MHRLLIYEGYKYIKKIKCYTGKAVPCSISNIFPYQGLVYLNYRQLYEFYSNVLKSLVTSGTIAQLTTINKKIKEAMKSSRG